MGCLGGLALTTGVLFFLVVFVTISGALFGNALPGVVAYLILLYLLPQLHRRAFRQFAGGAGNLAYYDHGLMFKSVAISRDLSTVYLGTLLARKGYRLQDIRQWSVWREQRSGMFATNVLKLQTADVNHPEWQVPFYRFRRANKWVEILQQATSGQNQGPALTGAQG